jgi:hypothetical protein
MKENYRVHSTPVEVILHLIYTVLTTLAHPKVKYYHSVERKIHTCPFKL